MAAELWLLRHGHASATSSSGSDADRPLTERGEAQSRAAGAALRTLEVAFEAVYTSPKQRAFDTARLACEAMGAAAPIVHEPLRGGFSAADALALAGAHDERLLVVGHNPDFSEIVFDLTGARVSFAKGAIAAVAVRDRALLALLRPEALRAIG